jgi:hypothetical protein
MKKIEELAAEKYISEQSLPERKRMPAENYIDWAVFGVKEAQRWIPVEEELPITYESGNWDGLRGSFAIVYDSFGEWHKARPYSGFLDGHNFYDWYSESDYMLSNITHWRPIERI